MIDLTNKTPEELQKIISEAQTQLEEIQRSKYKEVVAQIKELAASIGVTVEIHEGSKKGNKNVSSVPAKYRHPEDHSITWTGRGMAPKWLKALIDSGHNKEEFLIQD